VLAVCCYCYQLIVLFSIRQQWVKQARRKLVTVEHWEVLKYFKAMQKTKQSSRKLPREVVTFLTEHHDAQGVFIPSEDAHDDDRAEEPFESKAPT
jgi:hypothetical protein